MVYRDIEKSLNLLRVEIHCQNTVHPCCDEKVGDEFGRNRYAGLILAVLSGVPEKRQYRGDPEGAGTAGGIHHNQEFHQVLIGRWAGGLDDEEVVSSDIFVELHERLTIGKRSYRGFPERDFYEIGDPLGQLTVGVAREDL